MTEAPCMNNGKTKINLTGRVETRGCLGLFAFIKEAGEKLSGTGEANAATTKPIRPRPIWGAQAIHNYIVAAQTRAAGPEHQLRRHQRAWSSSW